MAKALYPYLPSSLCRFKYSNLEHVKSINCPLLVIHSRKDEVVPFAQGRAVFDAATTEKEFFEISGGHNDGFDANEQAYIKKFDEFASKHLNWGKR